MTIKYPVGFFGAYNMCFIVPMSSIVENRPSNISELFLIIISDVLNWECTFVIIPRGNSIVCLDASIAFDLK